jgi:hypothetical protein
MDRLVVREVHRQASAIANLQPLRNCFVTGARLVRDQSAREQSIRNRLVCIASLNYSFVCDLRGAHHPGGHCTLGWNAPKWREWGEGWATRCGWLREQQHSLHSYPGLLHSW